MTRHVTRLTKFPATVIAAVVLAASPRPGLAQDAAAPAASAPPTVAEAAPARPEVVVSASRLLDGVTGSSTTVIASERIKRSPASTLPELLSLEAGIQARDLFGGTGASRANIDMRGFGAVGAQNALILIDGRRLNDIDLAAIDYASIPLDSIDRIEIIRGSAGAVLYGDGAVGGVVNIVTKSATDTTTGGAADIAIGSEVYREANVSGRTTVGRFSMNAYGSAIESKGYRANNDLRQKNALAELRHRGDGGDVFVKFQADNQRLGLPGGRRETLGTSELHPDFVRRLATNPADKGFQSGLSGSIGISRRVDEGLDLVVDMGVRSKDQDAIFLSNFGNLANDTILTTWSLTPRAIIDTALGVHDLHSIIGVDYYFSNYDSNRRQDPNQRPIHVYDAKQNSVALYAQNTLAVTEATAVSLGGRVQYLDFSASDAFDPTAPGGAFGVGATAEKDNRFAFAFHAGADHALDSAWTVFGRASRSLRLPTIDERIGTALGTNLGLKPQRSWDLETGFRFEQGPWSAQASGYVMWLRDEIRLDPEGSGCVVFFAQLFCFGANENTDDTRRYGLEAGLGFAPLDDLTLRAALAYARAQFTAGPFDGNDVPLVAPWTASAGAEWRAVPWATVSSTVNFVGPKRFENDERNFQPKIPSYALWDAKISGQVGAGTWSVQANNILDKDYFNFGVASSTAFGTTSVFPLPGRTFLFRLGVAY